MATTAVKSFLDGDLLWVVFPAVVLTLALVPPATYRDPTVMLPWEVLAFCSLSVGGQALATTVQTTDLATYLSVAALALVAPSNRTCSRRSGCPLVRGALRRPRNDGDRRRLGGRPVDRRPLPRDDVSPAGPVDRPAWVADGGAPDALAL